MREADAEQVAALFVADYGEARALDAEEIRSWIRNEELPPENLRVLEERGVVVGYGDLSIEDDGVQLDVAAPGRWEQFFEWAEERGRTAGSPRVRAYFPAGHALEDVAQARGYRFWRSSFTMEMPLTESPPPALPDGFESRTYRPVDREPLRDALNDAFSGDPFFHEVTPSNFREFHLRARGFDPSLWQLAWAAGDELAGFSLAFPEYVGDTGLGWIANLGVRAPWRRRGLGEALLRRSFRDLHARGLRRGGLGVDAENPTGALRLYERVGLRSIRRNDNWVLDL